MLLHRDRSRSDRCCYREFHTHVLPEESLTSRIRAAVADMLAGAAYDPDYDTSLATRARRYGP